MDNTIFDIEEYTDEHVRRIMQGNTCRHCANRVARINTARRISYCTAYPCKRTETGFLRVKANQPACIRFTHKDNSKD